MSDIETSIIPLVSTIGFGGIVGFLVNFAIKRIMKILAIITGVFLLLFYRVSAYNNDIK